MQEPSEVQLTGIHAHAHSEIQQSQGESDHSNDPEIGSNVTFQQKLDTYEAQLLIQYLKAAGGNKRTLAKQLGISRATLYNRMKRLGL
ncbi:helix-turn-helix domain-containing protein [Paenibacillus amylolyticus]|nr:helix-turn-helix domain-containing protein [Paenibacillus amylolyticus]WFR65709.1 helix-turn-helix domain-containing protein [Paenibacillus amylolyticus]